MLLALSHIKDLISIFIKEAFRSVGRWTKRLPFFSSSPFATFNLLENSHYSKGGFSLPAVRSSGRGDFEVRKVNRFRNFLIPYFLFLIRCFRFIASRTPALTGAAHHEVMTADAGVFSLSPFATIILLEYSHHSKRACPEISGGIQGDFFSNS